MRISNAGNTDAALREQRQAIVRGLSTINSLNLAVVVLVAALAFVTVFLGLRARENAERLWAASVTQARASRFGGEIGWKSNALATISAASEIRPSLALRNEAIAALTTLDLEPAGKWYGLEDQQQMLAYDNDLKRVALADADGTVRVVQLENGQESHRFKLAATAGGVAFDPSGNFLVARAGGSDFRIWDLRDASEVTRRRISFQNSTSSKIEFVGGSAVLATGDSELIFISVHSGQESKRIKLQRSIAYFAASPDDHRFVVANGTNIDVLTFEGKVERQIACPGYVSSLATAGRYLAAGSEDHRVYLWNLSTGDSQLLSGHRGLVFGVEFNRTGTRLASCAWGGTARIWETSSGAPLLATESLFFSRFGAEENLVGCARIISGFGVYRLMDSGVVESFGLPGEAENWVGCSQVLDGRRVLTCRTSGAQLVDLHSREVTQLTRNRRARGAIKLDDKLITSSLDGLQFWPFEGGQQPLETIPLKEGVANEMIFLGSDRKSLLARIEFRGAVLLHLDTRKVQAIFNVPNIGNGEISPDGKWVAIGTFHGAGTKVFTRHGELVKDFGGRDASVQFSPNGRWLANVSAEACELFEVGSWRRIHRMPLEAATGLPGVLAFSPDSTLLAFTRQRRMIKVLDPESGADLASLIAPQQHQIDSLMFSPDNSHLIGSTSDALLQVWNIATLRHELAARNLDWPEKLAANSPQNIITLVVIIAVATLVLAIAYSLLAWLRHRQFLGAYARVENLIDERNRELAAAQVELFQSQKMRALGTLAAGIAHDFNNLLSIIRMSNKLTAEEARGNPEIEENVGMIEKAVGQGKDVVRSMLGYCRGDGESMNYHPNEVVHQTLQLVKQQFLQEIRLETKIDPNLSQVRGIRNRLEQILLNLIINASEAMHGHGELQIAVARARLPRDGFVLRPKEAESYVEISISDSGPGISNEMRSRVFEPFFTTKNVGTDRGTGLGLSMVYALAQEEGIGLVLHTELGKGTTFRLLLPAR